jgi:FMN-dependent NADH-azoreductase
MWNFSIPYRLKHYFDVIVQPGYTFSFSPEEGYKGLVTGKPVFVSYARGGEYPPKSEMAGYDLQSRYVELILGFIGLTEVKSVFVEPTLAGGPDGAKKAVESAVAKAEKMARKF